MKVMGARGFTEESKHISTLFISDSFINKQVELIAFDRLLARIKGHNNKDLNRQR